MKRKSFCLLVMLIGIPSAQAQEGNVLTSDKIINLLKGNSITAPEFGCAYYVDERHGIILNRSGAEIPFRWGSIDDKYFSSGQCGRDGCTVTQFEEGLVFNRTDGNYLQSVTLHRGNQCTGKTVLLR